MLIGLILLANTFGTLDIQEILTGAEQAWEPDVGLALVASALLLARACIRCTCSRRPCSSPSPWSAR